MAKRKTFDNVGMAQEVGHIADLVAADVMKIEDSFEREAIRVAALKSCIRLFEQRLRWERIDRQAG